VTTRQQRYLIATVRELRRLKGIVNCPVDSHIWQAPELYAASQIFGRESSNVAVVKPNCLAGLIESVHGSYWMSRACHAPDHATSLARVSRSHAEAGMARPSA